jgi:formamidopyrimidine-DNA glycosylase
MPEMPEVETIAADLRPLVRGRRIVSVDLPDPSAVRAPRAPSRFRARMAGARIVGLERVGKYLIFGLDSGDELVVHLRMTGRLIFDEGGGERMERERVAIGFADGSVLRFIDLRRLGTVHLVDRASDLEGVAAMGADPLGPRFTAGLLRDLLRRRRSRIKSLLMDQRFLAGLGNIYANEALYRAGIRPTRRAHTLTKGEVCRLHRAIRHVLRKGVAHGGASVRTYRRPDGSAGRFQETFAIYNRTDEPCPSCGRSIKRITLAGRGTYYCPRCQR